MTKPDGEAYFRELYRTFFDPRTDRELVDSVVEEASRVPVDIRVKELRILAADTVTPAATMRQPILFIAGTWMADMFPHVLDRSRLRSFFPLAKSTDLALAIGTGHFEQLEVPEQTNAFLATFISRLI
jgi:pimeloyl-ACP methyl ester carboxylesterase